MKIKYLVITVVLAAAVFGFGPSVKAIDNSELIVQLRAQIQALMQQINQLQTQQGTTQAWCHTFNANIGMGQKTGNPEIEGLVTVLQKEGLIDQGAGTEGYDENLASAVTGFQEKYASEILTPSNLKHGTGFVGKATRAKLNSLYGCNADNKVCPMFSQPLCKDGEKIIFRGFDENGCALPGKCVGVVCTQEAKQCTNGSYVSRTGPNCEFAPCLITQSQSAMKIISPNGGETYKKDGSITVNWKTAGVSESQNFDVIRLRAYPNGQEYNLISNTLNDGIENIAIPSSVPVGAYTLEIKSYIDNVLIFDASDSYFKIVSEATTCPNIQCFTDNCLGNHLSDANGCVNCSTPCAPAQPSITNISPSSGPINSAVIITGSNFTSTGNQVLQSCPAISSGSGAISIPSVDDRTLAYTVSSIPVQDSSSINYPLTCNFSVKNANGASNSVPFTIIAPTKTNYSLNISSVAGMKSVYASGEKISFSLKGVEVSDGSPASDAEGFNVQAYICKNGDCNNYLTPNPASSYNGNYNPSTGLWDVSMTAPSDSVPAYSMKVVLYCSQKGSYCWNNYRGAGSIDTQVEKLFNFIVTPATQPSITVTSPNGGEQWIIGSSNVITWTGQGLSVGINNYHGSNNIDIELTKGGSLYRGLNDSCSVISINSSGGSANCVIPSDVLAGVDYKIATIDNTAKVSDSSDNYFSIAAPTTGLNVSQNSLASISDAVARLLEQAKQFLGR